MERNEEDSTTPATFLTDVESLAATILADRERPRTAPITLSLSRRGSTPAPRFSCPRRLKTSRDLNNGIETRIASPFSLCVPSFLLPQIYLAFRRNFERNIALNFHLLILHLVLSFSQSKSCIVDYFDKEEEILNWILVWTLVRMKEYGMERNAILCGYLVSKIMKIIEWNIWESIKSILKI